MHQTVEADSVDFEHVEVKQEVNQCDEIDDPADESFEEYDDENQDETYSEKPHNHGSHSKVWCFFFFLNNKYLCIYLKLTRSVYFFYLGENS